MKQWRPTPVLRRRYHLDRRPVPVGVWIFGLFFLAGFVEVWQSTRVSQLALEADRVGAELARTEARRDYLNAQLAATRTRPALAAMARRLGMKPADPKQTVLVPTAYLAGGDAAPSADRGLAALGRRTLGLLVGEARARSR